MSTNARADADKRLTEALHAHAQQAGVPVTYAEGVLGGGTYERDRSGRRITLDQSLQGTSSGNAVLAHELGHAEFDKSVLGRIAHNPELRGAASLAPLIGMVIAMVADGNVARKAALSVAGVAASQVPLLTGEGVAWAKGHRTMKERGATPEQMQDYRRNAALYGSSYLGHGILGVGTALGTSALSHRSNMNKQANLLNTAGRFIAQNRGATAAIGAGLGTAAGVAREAVRAPEERNYLGGAITGAMRGGVAGAGVGMLGRAARDTMLLNPQMTGALNIAKGTAARAGQGVSNLVQRQVHGLTGYGANDAKYLDRIGIAGSGTSARNARLDMVRAMDMAKYNPAKAQKYIEGASQSAAAHHAEGQLGDRFRELGMTHAPGAVKAFARDPRAASKAVWDQMRSGGAFGTFMSVGAPVGISAMDLRRGDESATGGLSMREKSVRAAANVGGGFMFSGLPMLSQNLVGQGVERLGMRAAKAFPGKAPAASPSQIG
jgi:hypothetical protein